MLCLVGVRSESRRTLGVVSKFSFNERHSFGTLLEHSSNFHNRQDWKTEVRVAADYPDSKPDASSFLSDLGYHPLEDVSSFEKKKNIEHTDRKLTDAEVARTLAEVNEDAILYASVVEDEDHVFGTEVQYLVDEHGDFYFQIDDDSEFLTTLNSAGSYMNIAIGYESIEDWVLEQQEVHEENTSEETENIDNIDDNMEDGESWIVVSTDGVDVVMEELEEDSAESIGDWSGLDTFRSVHPLDFAGSLAKAASADHVDKIDKPSKSLRIVGEVRRLNEDEENYVQQLWYDRFRLEGEDGEDGEQSTEQVEGVVTGEEENVLYELESSSSVQNASFTSKQEFEFEEKDDNACSSSGSSRSALSWQSEAGLKITGEISDDENLHLLPREVTAASLEGSEESEQLVEAAEFTDVKSSFYKLDIQSIHVVSGFGAQSSVDRLEFQAAKPDVLSHFAPAIIERLNARGKTTQDALKALCLDRKGLEAEEVDLIELDSLGMDLRVHCGREVQTVRISLSQRATSVEHAEELLNQLLYPRVQNRGRRRRRSRSQGKNL